MRKKRGVRGVPRNLKGGRRGPRCRHLQSSPLPAAPYVAPARVKSWLSRHSSDHPTWPPRLLGKHLVPNHSHFRVLSAFLFIPSSPLLCLPLSKSTHMKFLFLSFSLCLSGCVYVQVRLCVGCVHVPLCASMNDHMFTYM